MTRAHRSHAAAIALILLGLWNSPSIGQTVNSASYPFAPSSGQALEDMSSGTTTLLGANLDDNVSAVTPLGFEFWFVGTRYTQFSISANGLMRLGSAAVAGTFVNDLASGTNVPQIAPYWDDLLVGTNGKVHSRVVGTAPNRKLVVEWLNVQVPRVGAGSTGSAVFQCWLSETSGRIDFVYGNGMGANGVNGGASIGFGNTAVTFASVTASGPAVAYGSANNANVGTIAAGTMFSFVPPRPAAPSDPTASGVSATALTLHWTDNATNEIGYAVYRSTDGVNFTYLTQLPANSTALPQTGLMPNTAYTWSVQALTEGAMSHPLLATFSTTAAGMIVTAGSGSWGSTVPDSPWPSGIPPTASDDVTIADGHVVTIDTPAVCHSLTVGQGASGTLEYEPGTARTLTVGANVHIQTGGTFRSAASGTQTGHVLSVGTDLENDGTLDFSTNGNTAGARITFTGASDRHFGGSGGTTNIRALTLDKGSSFASTLTLDPVNFTVQGASIGAPSFLTLTNGTFHLGGSFGMSSALFGTAAYSIGATTGLWIDNSNFTVNAQAASPTLIGLLRMSNGTFRAGTAVDQSFGLASGSTVVIEGGQIDVTGRFAVTSATGIVHYTQSGGTLTANTLGQTSTTLASFDLGTSATSTVEISGGSIVLQLAATSGVGPRDFRNRAGSQNISGGSLALGNAASGPAQTYILSGTAPGVNVSNTSAAHTAFLFGATTSAGTTLLPAGTSLNLNGFRWTQLQGPFINHGTVIGTGGSSELYFQGTAPQTYSGTGSISPALRGAGLTIDNPAGVTLDPTLTNSFRTTRVNLVRGVLHNSQLVSLGDTALAATTQIGAAGLTDAGGAYDVAPVIHPLASSVAVQYLQEGAPRTTGFEIPPSRSLNALTVNNTNGVVLAGGALTVTGSATLTAGVITTTAANSLTFANSISSPPTGSTASYVNGPLGIQFTVSSATSRTFAIGAGGAYRPLLLKSVNTGGVARVYTAEVIPGATAGSPSPPLQALTSTRYWRLTNSGQLNATARVNLGFGADDNVGSLANVRVGQASSASGSYASLGGTTTGSQSSGTVESTANLTPGSDYFAIASTGSLATTWDGGAATNNWGDAANWNPDGVPIASTSVSLVAALPTTIQVNGAFPIGPLTVGANTTLALGSGSLTVSGDFNQAAGSVNIGSGTLSVSGVSTVSGGALDVASGTFTSTGAMTASGGSIAIAPAGRLVAASNFTVSGATMNLGTGTLEVQGALARTSGTFDSGSGTTILSGANTQAIGAGLTFYHLILRNGGAGKPKRLTGAASYTVNGDFTVESTAQIGLSTSDPAELNVWGNWNYLGVAGGTNVSALKIRLRGTGKTVNGAAPSGLAAPLASVAQSHPSDAMPPMDAKTVEFNFLTDPAHAKRGPPGPRGKSLIELENTLERRRGDVERLIHTADPNAVLVVNLDDVTLMRNPASVGTPATADAAPGDVIQAGPAAEFGMPVVVESGATYALGGNASVASGQSIAIAGRLDCGNSTIGGAGGVSVLPAGTLATTTPSANGLAATVVTSGTNAYSSGAIVEYNAAGNQTIHAVAHPAAALIRTAGSGAKALDADKILTGSSGPTLDSGALFVGAGTTFVDNGHRLSFTTPEFANVVVNGTYASSGAGSLSFESGPFESGIVAANGTTFGDLLLNFATSAFTINLNADGIANYSIRNLVLGGTAGSGAAGGTLRLSATGTTNLTITGNVSIAPAVLSNAGGGFTGTSGHTGRVLLLGNVTSTSTGPTQPLLGTTGTNQLVFAGTSAQALAFAADVEIASGSSIQLTNPSGLALAGSGRTYAISNGGSLDLGDAQISTGANTLALGAGSFLTRGAGRVVGRLKKAVPVGSPTLSFEIGTPAFDTPVSVDFSSVSTPGNLAVTTVGGDHPNLGTAGIDPAKSVNRTYTLDGEAVAFDSCAVTMGFAPSDIDAGANPASFFVQRYNAPSWTLLAPGARTGSSTQATGNTAFGEYAVGELLNRTITATAGAHGSITPPGSTFVPHGSSLAYTFTPDPGYHVSQVLVDGASIGAPPGYTFSNIAADHTIEVSFALNVYTIEASAGANGTITPAGSVSVVHGADQTFQIVPEANSLIGDVRVDGVSQGPLAEYTFTSVTGDHTIDATFLSAALVTPGPPASVISDGHPCVQVPIKLLRASAQAVRAFSVDIVLSPGLTLCSGAASITEGSFLNAFGPTAYFVTDHGAGSYTIDCAILGTDCGVTAQEGTLFTLEVQSALSAGSESIAVSNVLLRDCENGALAVAPGPPATVAIDHTNPSVTLLAPNGGSVATVGTTVPIAWTASDSAGVATVDLMLSLDDGSTYPVTIAAGIPNSGSYEWVVPNQRTTQARVLVTAHDENGNVASDASDAAFEIREVNVAPVLAAIGNRTVSEGQALDFSASATDANLPAQSLRFALDPGFPAGAAIDSTTGAFHWVPDEAQGPGDFPLTIRVTDDGAPPGTTSETISIHVDEVNAPPLLSTVPVSATIPELAPYTFTATSSDPDIPVQVPVFSLVGAPAGAAIDGATGQFTWTPGEADGPGTYPFSVRVSDGVLHADVPITLTVEDVNTPPQLAGVPATATLAELSPYTFTATATDSDLPAQELTYSLVGAPAGAAIDGSTGVFTWTPGETQGPGVYAFQVRAGDGVAATDAAIALTVEEVNAAPAITGVPAVATIPELSPYTFTASATDADLPAQTLVYSLIGAPAGAAIDGSTGEFTWTPSEAQGPGLYPFSVRVSDGTTNTDAPITLTVTEVNVAPVLSGVPAAFTIPALVVYTFTATATDADVPAQTLTFSLVGAPAGATIDGSSGVFAWTPGSDQAPGVYPFAVRVSDGTANTEASITLTVEEVTIAAIADLSAVQVNAGNPPGGTTRIQLTWSATPGGTAVEVYRAPFGAYPRYDDAGGTVPGVPTYPPPSPWTLTTVTSPGGLDSPTARDFYSYVAFVRGAGSNVSTVSNRTSGTLNYHLGDVSNGSTAGEGDNVVNTLDISLLGAHYGAAGSAVDAVAYLDVGPTTDFSTNARPTTDRLLNFEDLILFALNFQTVSAPSGTGVEEAPHRSAIATDEIYVETTGMVEPGSGISASLRMRATGAIHGLSTTLDWDAHVVRPIGHTPGGLIAQSGGMMFSPRAGTLDAVVLGAQAPGIAGEGTLGSVEFEVIAQGDPGIRIVNVQARDAGNRDLPIQPGVVGIPVRPAITVMAPARPNPFREHTAFTVSLARGASMHLAIYAVDGRLVRALAHGFREPGTYQFQWDGQDDHGRPAQSGVYFVRMTADGITSHQSIVHAR